MEIAEEEAREARIKELQERARRDAARDRGEEPDDPAAQEESKTQEGQSSTAANSAAA